MRDLGTTRIRDAETGELLHEGPTTPSVYEQTLAEHSAHEESFRRPIDTPYGPGWYDVRRPWHVHVENRNTRPVK